MVPRHQPIDGIVRFEMHSSPGALSPAEFARHLIRINREINLGETYGDWETVTNNIISWRVTYQQEHADVLSLDLLPPAEPIPAWRTWLAKLWGRGEVKC